MPLPIFAFRKYTNSQVYKKGKNDECLKRRFLWLFMRELRAGLSKAPFESPAEDFVIFANLCPVRSARRIAGKARIQRLSKAAHF
jgi:hypothetical protein